MKSISARSAVMVDADFDMDAAAVVERIGAGAVPEDAEHLAHAHLGIVLHMAHIGVDDIEPVLADDAAKLSCIPFSQAAIWALRSAMFCSGLRAG